MAIIRPLDPVVITLDGYLRVPPRDEPVSTWQSVKDRATTAWREASFVLSVSGGPRLIRPFQENPHYCNPAVDRVWKANSRGLYLLIHGLGSHPCIFDRYIAQLAQLQDFDLAVPFVPNNGNCALPDAADPILRMALSYAERHLGRPITIVTISRGAPIGSYIDLAMRQQSGNTPTLVVSIAGAHFGSRVMDRFHSTGIANLWYNRALVEELRYGSDRSRGLIERLREGTEARRRYLFYSTTNGMDSKIEPVASCHPDLRKGDDEEHFMVSGVDHSSIVEAVQADILARSRAFME